MRVGVITLVNLSLADVYIYINHTNPRAALHIAAMTPAQGVQRLNNSLSPLPNGHEPIFQSMHFYVLQTVLSLPISLVEATP